MFGGGGGGGEARGGRGLPSLALPALGPFGLPCPGLPLTMGAEGGRHLALYRPAFDWHQLDLVVGTGGAI